MPTSLTSSIYDGSDTSFRSYALKCAACIDYCYRATDGGSKPLPKDKAPFLQPEKRYKDIIKRYEAELAEYEALKNNPVQLKEAYKNEKKLREDYLNDLDDMSLERKELKKRYESMKDTVKSWHPGEEYNTLKSFMLEQLEKSIESDCEERKPAYSELPPMDVWVDNGIECLQESLDYYKKKYEQECKNVEKANAYLKGLYEELDKFEISKEMKQLTKDDIDSMKSGDKFVYVDWQGFREYEYVQAHPHNENLLICLNLNTQEPVCLNIPRMVQETGFYFLGAYDSQKVTKLRIEKLKHQEDVLAARVESRKKQTRKTCHD